MYQLIYDSEFKPLDGTYESYVEWYAKMNEPCALFEDGRSFIDVMTRLSETGDWVESGLYDLCEAQWHYTESLGPDGKVSLADVQERFNVEYGIEMEYTDFENMTPTEAFRVSVDGINKLASYNL